MYLVEKSVAAGVDAVAGGVALADGVEFAPGGQGREYLAAVRVEALGVLVALRRVAGYAEGHRAAPARVLEYRYQTQHLAGPYRRFCVVSSKVAVLCDKIFVARIIGCFRRGPVIGDKELVYG